MHRHVWVVTGMKELQSPIDVSKEVGLNVSMNGAWANELRTLTYRATLVTSRCEKCHSERVQRL